MKKLINDRQGQVEEKVDDITKQLQSFMEQSADAISIVDLDGKTLQVNAAFEEFFGWIMTRYLVSLFRSSPIS